MLKKKLISIITSLLIVFTTASYSLALENDSDINEKITPLAGDAAYL
jgi:hypothetical protein